MLVHNHFQRILALWCAVLAGLGVLILLGGCGTPTPKVYHVGMISGGDAFASIADGFKAKMTELGYVEGKNIVYDMPKATADRPEQLRIAQKFVADKVDLIFAFPTDPAVAAKTATQGTNIPVLFANASLEGNDLVQSVREPGGNITGVRFPGPEQTAKRLEILHTIAPQAKRIYGAYDPNYPAISYTLEQVRQAASTNGVTFVEARFGKTAELQADLDARAKASDLGMDAILIVPTSLTSSPESQSALTKFATAHNLPIAGSLSFPVEKGALFNNAVDSRQEGILAAPIADKIFKGVSAGTIPVASADSVVRINYKIAQQLGLTVPDGLLQQAADIIR